MVKNIWKSYIWTADKDVNESDPRSNMHSAFNLQKAMRWHKKITPSNTQKSKFYKAQWVDFGPFFSNLWLFKAK